MPAMLSDFHFLRPWYLSALLPCALLTLWFARRHRRPPVWGELIDPALLPHLLLPAGAGHSKVLPMLLFSGWALGVVALAGPAWERLPEPVERSNDALIIALELDASMRATDLAPSRLQRARHKIADILATRHEGLTALIVYAGDAHVVTPLSDDVNTLTAMLAALDPAIMPEPGNDPHTAAELAARLLHGAGLNEGRMLFVADAFPRSAQATVAHTLAGAGLSFSLLAVGTAQGAPVPLPDGGFLRDADGGIRVPGVDLATMRDAATAARGRFAQLGVDDSDIRYLLPAEASVQARTSGDTNRRFDHWQDRTPWLALALLPLAALAFRRGWLLAVTLVALLPTPHAEALEWRDLWLRKDQQGAQALAAGDAEHAAGLFRSPAWHATAQYQAGDYAGAARGWSEQDNAAAHYNRGNALARAGQLDEAIAAYDAALALEPQFADAATNRSLVEELARQRNANTQTGSNDRNGSQADSQDQAAGAPQADTAQAQSAPKPGSSGGSDSTRQSGTDAKADSATEPGTATDGSSAAGSSAEAGANSDAGADSAAAQQRQEHDAAGAGDESDQQTRNVQPHTPAPAEGSAAPTHAAEDAKSAGDAASIAAGRSADSEDDQAMEHWLRRIPDDPGELLRRKFEYENRLRKDEPRGSRW